MSSEQLSAIILAAGMGTRMKSARHKVLHKVAGRALIDHLMDRLGAIGADRSVIVVGAGREQVEAHLSGATFAVQQPQLGTGHAVLAAKDALANVDGEVLVLYGDVPFVAAETLDRLISARRDADDDAGPGLAILAFRAAEPGAYGRVVVNEANGVECIVEARDASPEERDINLCNSGILAAARDNLFALLERVENDNKKGEYYLTDVIALARGDGQQVALVEATEEEVMGINSQAELAAAEATFQDRRRREMMDAGVTLVDPSSVHFSADTVIGPDSVIEPNVVFAEGVRIGNGVTIRSFSHLEGATVADGAVIGPFARLRPGAEIGEGAKVGNFVEIKKAKVEAGAKVNHLTYVGDARVGAGANVGAGTITCNYDGFDKHFTDIGEGAFIGSNTALVAPVKIGAGAVVGAGSTITRDVEADALAVERAETKVKSGWAATFRHSRSKKKG